MAYDVQREMAVYLAAVELRNAVEQMLARHGRLDDPEHLFWGFGPSIGRWPGRGPRADDDGLAGSRVPRRPPGGSGAAGAEVELPRQAEAEARPIAR
jgi:hypothetical protein